MSRIGVTADLQLDVHARLSTLGADGLTTRLRDMLDCLDWIIATAQARKCEGLVLLGDIFDSRTQLHISVVDQVCRRIHAAAETGLKILVVVGNHDSLLRSPTYNSLQVFRGSAQVFEAPGTYRTSDGAILGLVPWDDAHDTLSRGIAQVAKAGAKFLFTHVLCEGVVPVPGKGFPVANLLPDRFTQVLLGDVHDPMELRENVRYVGAPLQIDYRDAGGTRGFCLLDTKAGTVEFVENTVSPRFHVIEDATVAGIQPKDFVRIKTDDPDIAAEAVAKVTGKAHHVETTFVPLDDTPARLDIRTDQEEGEILRRFVAHHGLAGADALIALGQDILADAKAEQ
jgi:DNA repair exonuclease SbcCD nuclease subunit